MHWYSYVGTGFWHDVRLGECSLKIAFLPDFLRSCTDPGVWQELSKEIETNLLEGIFGAAGIIS